MTATACMVVATWHAIILVFLNSCVLILFVVWFEGFCLFFGEEVGCWCLIFWLVAFGLFAMKASLPTDLFIHLHHFVAKIKVFLAHTL